MKTLWKYHKRELLYGILLAGALEIWQKSLNTDAAGQLALYLSGGIFIVCLLSFNISWQERSALRQLQLPALSPYSTFENLLRHYVLPSLTFVSLGLIYRQSSSFLAAGIILSITAVLFTALFIHQKATLAAKIQLSANTAIALEVSRSVVFFGLTLGILSLSQLLQFNYFVNVGILFCVSTALSYLILLGRKNYTILEVLFFVLAGLALGYFSASLFLYTAARPLITAAAATVFFYLLNSTLKHELEKDLNANITLEYLLIAIAVLLVILLNP